MKILANLNLYMQRYVETCHNNRGAYTTPLTVATRAEQIRRPKPKSPASQPVMQLQTGTAQLHAG